MHFKTALLVLALSAFASVLSAPIPDSSVDLSRLNEELSEAIAAGRDPSAIIAEIVAIFGNISNPPSDASPIISGSVNGRI
ncbi:hypothetical protein BD410DRAFT_790159 [Rickenella mellea]|uniref:Uncharacterized protein n=1 Tax=Rickenella mellea TaxID=50990 RepID=A0A4Y7Q0E2_9AGAM|nr:hypothetical protein BD410DRAFT_790159 [Rickenella mellea]